MKPYKQIPSEFSSLAAAALRRSSWDVRLVCAGPFFHTLTGRSANGRGVLVFARTKDPD